MHLLVRRIPKAVFAAAVTAFLLGGVIGFAAAAGDPEGIPKAFGVAEPRGGDRWEYDVTGVVGIRGTLQGVDVDEEVRFDGTDRYEWLESSVWLDAEGRHHAVRLLAEDFRLDASVGTETFSEAVHVGYVVPHEGDGSIALFTRGNSTDRFPVDNGLPFVLNEETQGAREQRWVETTYGEGVVHPFCGFRSTLQGGEVDLQGGVRFAGECSLGELEQLTGSRLSDVYDPHSVDDVRGMQAVRFQQGFAGGQVDIWMARHVPYPVKSTLEFAMDLQDVDPSAPAGLRLHLTVDATMSGFEPGTETFAPDVDVPAPRSLPQVRLADRHVWGPDEGGLDHPYPLSHAFQLAMADDELALGEFMERHDDASVTHAEAWQVEVDDTVQHHWTVQVDDGDDAFTFHTWQTTQAPEPMLADLGLAQARNEQEHEAQGDALGPPVDPADLPDRLPTVASVAARWSAMFPDEGAADAWSFSLSCGDAAPTSGPCAGQSVAAGIRRGSEHAPAPTAPVTGDEGSADARLHMLGVDATGQTIFVRQATAEERYRFDGLVPVAADDHEDDAPADPAPVATVQRGVWRLPPAGTAGVTAAALLVGLAYWLWPVVKGGGIGLFSRVHGPQLLEHPVRAQLMDMVRSQPGIHYQGLVRGLGRGRGVVEHHMRKLQQSGFVSVQRTEGLTCFFPKGAVDRRVMAAVPAIKTKASRSILEAVVERPDMTQKDIAGLLKMAPSTVNHHVRRLVAAGLVDRHATAQGQCLRATGLAAPSLAVGA